MNLKRFFSACFYSKKYSVTQAMQDFFEQKQTKNNSF